MKPIFYFLLALVPAMSALADESPNVAAPKTQNLLLQNVASYAEHGNFSDAARTECPVDIGLPKAVAKFANEYGIPVTLGAVAAPKTSDKPTVTLQIDNLVGGKFSMSRWVVSELGVTVSVKEGATEKMSNHFKCNAGPGFAFIHASACSRLDRCVEQIAARTAKWLGLAAKQVAPASPTEPTATGPSLAATSEK